MLVKYDANISVFSKGCYFCLHDLTKTFSIHSLIIVTFAIELNN